VDEPQVGSANGAASSYTEEQQYFA